MLRAVHDEPRTSTLPCRAGRESLLHDGDDANERIDVGRWRHLNLMLQPVAEDQQGGHGEGREQRH